MKAKFSMTRRRLLCRKRNQPELLGVLMNYSGLERDNGLSGSELDGVPQRRPPGSEREGNPHRVQRLLVCLSACPPCWAASNSVFLPRTTWQEFPSKERKREEDVFSEEK